MRYRRYWEYRVASTEYRVRGENPRFSRRERARNEAPTSGLLANWSLTDVYDLGEDLRDHESR